MNCPKCGKSWNQFDSIKSMNLICPFCNHQFVEDDDTSINMSEVLRYIIEKYGMDLLKNPNRVNAFLMDLAPRAEKERKLIVHVLREGTALSLFNLKNKNPEQQKNGINKCIHHLIEDNWITEAAAYYAVITLANALNIYIDTDYIEQISEPDYTQTTTTHIQHILSKNLELSSIDAVNDALRLCHTIGYKALAANKNLKYLQIPENVKYIYPKAFLNCINLRQIILPSNLKEVGYEIFTGCCMLEAIYIEDNNKFIVLDNIFIDVLHRKTIRAENNDDIHTISIPSGIYTIGKKTFERNTVKQIDLPHSIENIETDAFYLTLSLESFMVDPHNIHYRSVNGVLYSRNEEILLRYPQGKLDTNYVLGHMVQKIDKKAFSCSRYLETVTFTTNLKCIDSNAFEYCSKLENLILPTSINKIGERAFQYCPNLKNIMLSKSITEISDCTFYNCSSLQNIDIPNNVQKIGHFAFANCQDLKQIIIQENVSFIGDGAFNNCTHLEVIIKNNSYVEQYCDARHIPFKKI